MEEVFCTYVAPDFGEEGKKAYREEFLHNPAFHSLFREGKQTMYGAFSANRLVGVAAVSSGGYLSCLFVDGAFHGRGIGSALLCTIARQASQEGLSRLRVSASPFAVGFYHALGFTVRGPEQQWRGIRTTPMEIATGCLLGASPQNTGQV